MPPFLLFPSLLASILFHPVSSFATDAPNFHGRFGTSLRNSGNMDLLDSRLSNIGAKSYQFVRTDDGSIVGGSDNIRSNGERKDIMRFSTESNVQHIKTLIWEAVVIVPCSSGSGGRIMEEVIDHYFVTALRVEDRVDLQKLYELVKEHTLQATVSDLTSQSKRLMLRLANRDIAETLAGFQSGTIPPIAHTTPLPLYIDDIVASNESSVASLGSGTIGYDLYIPILEVVRISQLTSSATYVNALTLKKQSSPKLSLPEELINNDDRTDSVVEETTAQMSVTYIEKQMTRAKGKAARAKLLRSAAKKQDNVEVLSRMLKDIGDEFPSLMDVEEYGSGGIDKNALHIAAWKGDLESMTLLIEMGKRFDLDLVNMISVGEGNYGKTPIFYSLTQCREDAVLLLIEHKADLLILNNKGQSPCSIAVSHLKPEMCQLLYDIEASQLQAGGRFKNYRQSHSDGSQYGDLDPRFEIDQDNMGDDLISELESYHQIVNDATTDAINMEYSSKDRYEILQSTAIPGLPRSMRQTTRHWNKPKQTDGIAKSTAKEKQSTRKSRKVDKQEAKDDIDYDSLEKLSFDTSIFCGNHRVRVVNDAAGISDLCQTIDRLDCSSNIVQEQFEANDADIVRNSWALDAEWQPSHTKGQETPVATLQLHHTGSNSSFLLDLQVLFQAGVADADASMTENEQLLSDALLKIFLDRRIALLGFGIGMDLGKLAASFPHLPCFRRFDNVIDLHAVSRIVYAGSVQTHMSNLKKMVAVLLKLSIDKTEQCSDWDQRPLTESQINYALLDAAVLPILFRTMLSNDGIKTEHYGVFIQSHPHLQTTTKLMCLGAIDDHFACAPQLAFSVPHGSCKIHLQHIMSRQTWITGNDDPNIPEMLPIQAQQSIALSRIPKEKRIKEKGASSNGKSKGKMPKKKILKLSEVSIDFTGIPTPGTIIDYTKDSCIHELLGMEFVESLMQQDTRLGFNKRGGVICLENVYCLFVNFSLSEEGALPSHWVYRNDFMDSGRMLTFTINCERDDEQSLSDFFTCHEKSNDVTKVILFARPRNNAKFIYCGECACAKQTQSGNIYTNLFLELMDFDQLVAKKDDGEPSPFNIMVELHHAAALFSSS